jgi:hypothetical protein
MKHYSKFFEIYTVFHALVRTQYYAVIKCFKCDLDEKYTSNKFCELFALDETIHRILYSYTPEQMVSLKENIGTLLSIWLHYAVSMKL